MIVDDVVETHPSGILFQLKSKKLQQYVVNSLYFDKLQFSKQEWSVVAPSIFNIKTRELVHCIHSLYEVELRQSLWVVFSWHSKNMLLYVPVIRKCHTTMKRHLARFVLAQFYLRNATSLTLFFDIEH